MQERLINLLEVVAAAGGSVSASDLASITDIPRTTLYRNLASLVGCGFLDETEDGMGYTIGQRFLKIAVTGWSDSGVIDAVSTAIQKLVERFAETAFLARLRSGSVDLIRIQTPPDPSKSYFYPGLGRRPAHACSSAKAIAAFTSPELREGLLEGKLTEFTEKTIVDRDRLARELKGVREQGYAVCDGEIDEGVTSIAVPIIVEKFGVLFSLGLVGPSSRIKPALSDDLPDFLLDQGNRATLMIRHHSKAL